VGGSALLHNVSWGFYAAISPYMWGFLFIGVLRGATYSTALCVKKKGKETRPPIKKLVVPFSPPPQVAPPSGAKFKMHQVSSYFVLHHAALRSSK